MSTTLAVSHYLYLTKAERYAWHVGQSVEVVGVSIPVWFYKGMSSEPAIEVFCKYHLINTPEGIFVKNLDDGYEIQVPQKPEKEWEPLPDEAWNSLSKEAQEQWYESNEPKPSLSQLLDIRDGGAAYLAFRQYSKVRRKKKILNVVHFVEIKDMQDLVQTLT